EVGVGEEVDLPARVGQPLQERLVVVPEVGRHAAPEERPRELRPVLLPAGVPRVAATVVVVVAEVVRLPRERRQDDEDAVLTEPPRRDDERREPDATDGGTQLREVESAR